MDEKLTQKAIDLAINCSWNDAIKINLQILVNYPEDIDTLNRLSVAYYNIGNLPKAKKTSLKVIKIDKLNNIARKSLEKYKSGLPLKSKQGKIDPSIFIEELGKTKLTNLINIGSNCTSCCLSSGDEVLLTPHTHKVTVTTTDGKYIGKLTDDLSAKLRRFIKGGNEYKTYIITIDHNNIRILIKETKRGEEFKNTQSFPRENLEPISEFSADSDF